ncbi:peptide-methionine (S)-S-oxide reductase MsrA [Devosia neptuniae]|jgi:peptide-methionine (S)-S-oxide reductase|uniref:peptide-methionine (S)-S-oxide reductase MsrA n=1 Tax=Devosia TaxID=46913 RepID=UPI0022B06A9E|nr:peptide-methionine (S)-S-oxide reductase MsrA [Devosia neptuniae]MCZ4345151.1 peptide-methionine (S)-S-oxide reductase MsrA [Devosia neptuniae]|tara:strand:- start:7700 stop:8431 length:732 start_codon:yes stop_codon:yes gene_type:complete
MSRTLALSASRQNGWRVTVASLLLLPAIALGLFNQPVAAQEAPVVIPAPALDLTETGSSATAIFAGGCFWGVQGVFQHVNGVTMAVSGYSGGAAETATYELTGSGTTGHAEAVQVNYDPAIISYGELLQIYFSVAHNPTQLNYQGPDRGTQYRSTIFAVNDEQAETAKSYIEQLDAADRFEGPIVTTIEPFEAFYAAEQYHQDFLTLNPSWPYIVVHDLPKIAALEAIFPESFREDPVLVGSL